MATAKSWEVTDEFWKRVEPLIPIRQRQANQSYPARLRFKPNASAAFKCSCHFAFLSPIELSF